MTTFLSILAAILALPVLCAAVCAIRDANRFMAGHVRAADPMGDE